MYNEGMNNKKSHFLLNLLIVLLIAAAAFGGFAFYRLNQAVHSIASDFSAAQSGNPISISDSTQLAKFYETLYGQLDQYGGLESTEDAFAGLLSEIFVKTMKDCTIESVDFEADKILVHVQGIAVPADELNEELLVASITKAAFNYLSHDFLGAAASLFQGTDGIKRELYGKYAGEFLETLKNEIAQRQAVPVSYQLSIRLDNGRWIVDAIEQNPQPDSSSRTSSSSSSQTSALPSLAS